MMSLHIWSSALVIVQIAEYLVVEIKWMWQGYSQVIGSTLSVILRKSWKYF